MIICYFDILKKSSRKKETGIEKEMVEVSQKKVKDPTDKIFGFNLVFVG